MPVKFRHDLLEDYYAPEVAEVIRKESDPYFSYSGAYAAMMQTPDATIGNNISQYNTQNTMKKGYTVSKLADLAREFNFPSSKGYKTKDYLELVIKEVENKGFRFIQFLQLVDVLYIIIENPEETKKIPVNYVTLPPDKFRAEEEIEAHYVNHPDLIINQQIKESNATPVRERESVTEAPPELEQVKSRTHLKRAMKKNPLPWEK